MAHTCADEAQRHAYNSAFNALDLDWHWDAETYARLAPHGSRAVRVFLETELPHLLRAYDPDSLAAAIEGVRSAALNQNVSISRAFA